jgi:hypothetical protein
MSDEEYASLEAALEQKARAAVTLYARSTHNDLKAARALEWEMLGLMDPLADCTARVTEYEYWKSVTESLFRQAELRQRLETLRTNATALGESPAAVGLRVVDRLLANPFVTHLRVRSLEAELTVARAIHAPATTVGAQIPNHFSSSTRSSMSVSGRVTDPDHQSYHKLAISDAEDMVNNRRAAGAQSERGESGAAPGIGADTGAASEIERGVASGSGIAAESSDASSDTSSPPSAARSLRGHRVRSNRRTQPSGTPHRGSEADSCCLADDHHKAAHSAP